MKEGWENKKLGDVCDIINGKNQKKVENPHGLYPIMGSGGIMGFADEYLCNEGTTIIGRKGTINKPIYVDRKFWNVDTAFGLQPKNNNNSKFLYYLCRSIDFAQYDRGVTIPSLVKSELLQISVSIPSFQIQQKIVSELDLLSGIIEKEKAQLEELDKLSQSIFYDMFGDSVNYEKEWIRERIGSILETSSGGTPSKTIKEYYEGGTIPWLRSGEVSQGFIYESELCITQKGLNNSSAKVFPIDTVVIAMYGATVGQVGVIKKEMATNQAICGIFPNNYFIPTFLYYFLKGMKPIYLKDAAGGAQPNISQGIIKNTLVPLAPLSLQQEFADKIYAIEAMKTKVLQSLKETEQLFNSRMDYYFN